MAATGKLSSKSCWILSLLTTDGYRNHIAGHILNLVHCKVYVPLTKVPAFLLLTYSRSRIYPNQSTKQGNGHILRDT